METQKFMGKGKLIDRLTSQTKSKKMAFALLTKRGHLKGGKLTAEGKKRDAMTAEERAKDRVGGDPGELAYNPKTNRATLRGKK